MKINIDQVDNEIKNKLIYSARDIKLVTMLKENHGFLTDNSGKIRVLSSIVISLFFNIYLVKLNELENIKNYLDSIINTLIGGYIGWLAFSLSGVALITSTLTNSFFIDLVKKYSEYTDKEYKDGIKKIRSIFFPFYFSTVINFVTLIVLIFSSLLLKLTDYFCWEYSVLISTLVAYSLWYNAELIPFCIQVRFLGMKH